MDFFILAALAVIAALALKARDHRARIVLLASHLGQYQIEKLMENLTQGYLRCLGEDDPARRDQIWNLLNSTEDALANQFQSFAAEFSRTDELSTRVSTLPIGLPYAAKLAPAATFDLRKAFAIHARGIADTARNARQLTPKRKAFTMSAELFLMQHTCHWYCKSKAVASARMLARHQTRYDQLIDAVSPETRQAYMALVGR
ncbi:hypothetical protein [Variovorax ginsengisoli]|uniref:DUF4760 domain-containing protein n=1 Tax=Variovorax ginsengisoli TaxID=363844 RepID=A0ABT9SFE9_9BURK|nr:hypothetical protein [Variovorax ginsengisoli]MDP9902523.1 hypothetical protein [Variovorax ginsengisoli]